MESKNFAKGLRKPVSIAAVGCPALWHENAVSRKGGVARLEPIFPAKTPMGRGSQRAAWRWRACVLR